MSKHDETAEGVAARAELEARLAAAEAEVARLRLEVWELRDALIGSSAQERTVSFMLTENDRLRYLMHRPWRPLGLKAKNFVKDVLLRVESKRTETE